MDLREAWQYFLLPDSDFIHLQEQETWVAGPVPESLLVKVSAKKNWADSNWNCAHTREFLVFLHRVAESFHF